MIYGFKGLLTETGWKSPAFVEVDQSGKIVSIKEEATGDIYRQFDAYVLPGFQNAHSHSFQYAMSGLAEIHDVNGEADDFWSWRETMYKIALTMDPDQFEAIATQLYAEMLRHGYTSVAEFHYLHHDKDGNRYNNHAELGSRLVNAAKKTGMGITLVPIFYQKGGFGMEPNDRQRRFISSTIDDYFDLYECSKLACSDYDRANVAVGIHSLRGVSGEDIIRVSKEGEQDVAFHIHVSEQLKEIEDSISYLGKRPVEWLLDNVEMNDRYQLVHATHLVDSEVSGIARSGAQVVLCPSTEGNLGDGLFPYHDFKSENGNWCIGTDSHIGLNPLEELRILDYGQRLITHKRNTYVTKESGDSAFNAIQEALVSGRKAVNNRSKEFFKEGACFDAVMIDASAPLIATSKDESLTAAILYSSDASNITGTFAGGKLVVENGRHSERGSITSDFVKTIGELGIR